MGQEASIPSRQGEGAASPQAGAHQSSSAANSSSETTSQSSSHASSQPQARKKPSGTPAVNNPPNTTNNPNTAPLMSRAGLSSMIQRMGVPSTHVTATKKSKKSNIQRGCDEGDDTNTTSAAANTMGNLVNKMTDLVIGENNNQHQQTMQPTLSQTPTNMQQPKLQPSDEDDWEKAWAEDSESDEEEEQQPPSSSVAISPIIANADQSEVGGSLRLNATSPVMGGQYHTVSSNFRPELDSGFGNMGVGIDLGDGDLEKKLQQNQQQLVEQPQKTQQQQQQQVIQQTEISRAISPEDTTIPNNLQPVQDELGEDQVKEDWEGYHHESHEDMTEAERPCVDMFDPALRVLGRGSFGRVVLVQKRYGHSQGGLYAMKILRKSHLVRRRQIERTKTERKVLSMLNHPFIMKLYYAFQTTEKLYLVLDYCPGGELFFHLSRYRRFQEPVARFYAAELLLAIGHLHKHGIIYRDLKPENVLLDAYGHVKLGDFGLAKDGIRHPTQGAKSTCGTPEYMAPEVLNQTGHGFCVDYWGLGMILYEMMTGLPPWYTTDRSKLFRRLRSAPLIFPNEVQFSPHCKACIAGLLERDPRLRLGVLGLRSAMRHEFFYRRINFEALRGCQIAAPIRPCEGWRQFANKNSTVDGSDSVSNSFRGHSAGPSFESAVMGQITMELLDVATENFDDTFRRMPIETEDYEKQQLAAGHSPITEKELNEQTFRGFTFDGDELMVDDAHQPQWQRQEQYSSQMQPQQLYQHQKLPQQQQINQQQNVQHQQHPQQQQQQQQQQNPHSHVPNGTGDRGEMI